MASFNKFDSSSQNVSFDDDHSEEVHDSIQPLYPESYMALAIEALCDPYNVVDRDRESCKPSFPTRLLSN